MIKSQLPEIYLRWFPKVLLDFEIQEKKATCENCALSAGKSPDKRSYQSHLKCCTFHPYQPNYLMGQILSSPEVPVEVLSRIHRKISNFEYVLPIGVVAPIPHQIEFNHRQESEFGNREDWLCPYFDRRQNRCGIWKSRSSVCTSFYCLSSYGSKGFEFWDELSDYISYVEMALMEEALVMLDFSPRQISDQLQFLNRFELEPGESFGPVLSEAFHRKIWNGYAEDPVKFYQKCFDIVSNLTQTQFKEALGDQGLVLQKKLLATRKGFSL